MAPPPAAQASRRKVIKKVAGHGHHGGAWKIAYADFVTAMMALFLVLWLLASTDQQSREEIAKYFRTGILPNADLALNGGAQTRPPIMELAPTPPKPETQTFAKQAHDLQQEIQELVENHIDLEQLADKVRVTVTEEGMLVEIDDDEQSMLFDSASSQLKGPLEDFLKAMAPILASKGKQIEIQGHTDARPFASGAGKTNWDLSYERAAGARTILEANGVPAGKIVGVIGRGAAVPLDPQDPYAARNRRLSLLIRNQDIKSSVQQAARAAEAAGGPGGDDPGVTGPMIRAE